MITVPGFSTIKCLKWIFPLLFVVSCTSSPSKPEEDTTLPVDEIQAPTAHFTVTPDTGTVFTSFTFDGTTSSDPWFPSSTLNFSWWFGGLTSNWQPSWTRMSADSITTTKFHNVGEIEVGLTVENKGSKKNSTYGKVFIESSILWEVWIDGDPASWLNTSSSPAIGYDGSVYIGSGDGYVYAFTENGELKWNVDTGQPVVSSPAIGVNGTIYIGTRENGLYAISPAGFVQWTYLTGDIVDGSPAIALDGVIYIASQDGYLHAVNPNGSNCWKYNIRQTTSGLIATSPSIGEDGTIYIGSVDGYIYAINPDGTLRWQYQTEMQVHSEVAINDEGRIYFGTANWSGDNYLYALNSDGNLLWRSPARLLYGELPRIPSPTVGLDGTIYIMTYDKLTAFNQDGVVEWRSEKYFTGSSSPTISENGKIFTSNFSGGIMCNNPDGSLSWWFQTEYGGFASPALINGVVYFTGAQKWLYAHKTESGALANSPWPKYRGNNQNTGRK